jgi:hypothetical protein
MLYERSAAGTRTLISLAQNIVLSPQYGIPVIQINDDDDQEYEEYELDNYLSHISQLPASPRQKRSGIDQTLEFSIQLGNKASAKVV